MPSQTTGYICVTVACLCFGSNFVPAKKVDIRDGRYFTFWLSIGIALVGLVQWLAMGMYKFEPLAMIGGATWATANLFAPFIIKRCGLGIGQLGWCATNMLMGWATGAFGLFGIEKADVARPNLNYFGVALSVAALLVITQMGKVEEPEQNKKLMDDAEAQQAEAVKAEQTSEAKAEATEIARLTRRLRGCTALGAALLLVLIGGTSAMALFQHNQTVRVAVAVVMVLALLALGPVGVVVIISRALLRAENTENAAPTNQPSQPSQTPEADAAPVSSSFIVQSPSATPASSSSKDFAIGLVVAMIAGLLMGCNFDIPTLLQQQGEAHGHSTNALDYVFSHYMGILALTSSFFGVSKLTASDCYCGKEIILPGLFAGVLWGIAQVCWFFANSALSYVVAFPIITGVPGVLAIIWGMLLFGENTDTRSLKLLGTIIVLSASSLGCIALSHGASS